MARLLSQTSQPGTDSRDIFEVADIPIDRETYTSAIDWITEKASRMESVPAGFVNAHCLMVSRRDRAYRKAMREMNRVFADGSGVRLAAKLLKLPQPENVNGTDLLDPLCARMEALGQRLFLFGARPGVADAMAARLRERYPNLDIVGVQHGYVDEDGEDDLIARINAARPHVLLVALGVPSQDTWIIRNISRLTVGVAMGVGGQFDFHSGRIPRAPKWMRVIGCEWVYRLRQEPRRMWRRYVIGNPAFVLSVIKQRFQEERRAQARERLQKTLVAGASAQTPGGPTTKPSHRLHRLSSRIGRGFQRGLDIMGSGCLLVALSPLLLAVAAAIRLESSGPVVFCQTRVGEGGRHFKVYKLRSMYRDAEARKAALMANNEMAGGVLFKMKNDPRITKVGKVIRKTSIDELPQLWNVLKGDMSLVGPRPALPDEVAQYSAADRRRLDGKPGITCIWQVSGRSSIPFEGQVRMDVAYNESRGLWMDILLLLKTIPAVLFARGAH